MAMEINGLLSKEEGIMSISVIILTFNSEQTIAATLESAFKVSDDIHIVDSHSSDNTLSIAQYYDANIVKHEFINYGVQRNWAINTLSLKYEWELHLDAEERLSEELIIELNNLKLSIPKNIYGYYIPRLIHFLNRPIRYGGMFPIWHLRLFKHGKGRCENRQYDQHFYVDGPTSKLNGHIIDDICMDLGEWVSRHNCWADAEMYELCEAEVKGRIQADLYGDPVQKKRFFRNIYNTFPLLIRPLLLFIYRYFLRFGFLDGREGLIFFVLQTFWFRFLVDAKIFERRFVKLNKG